MRGGRDYLVDGFAKERKRKRAATSTTGNKCCSRPFSEDVGQERSGRREKPPELEKRRWEGGLKGRGEKSL